MIGQYKRDLSVVPYRRGWKALYEQEAERLQEVLGEQALRIEHIGSTSIPGMVAKPIIDIMVGLTRLAEGWELIPVLGSAGYLYRAPDAIPGRWFFGKESAPEIRTHHLSLVELDGINWQDHLAFRDTLRAHEGLAAEYIALKRRLAEEYARTGQIPWQGKTAFVAKVLALAETEKGRGST